MPESIAERLAELTRLPKPALCDLWKQLFKSAPHCQLRKDLMRRILAHRLQEEHFGGLSDAAKRRLRHLASALESNSKSVVSPRPQIRPGTRLVREWRNQVHLVNVEDHGYEYQGARYQSLSEIARLITGTRWSGPLFFGIKGEHRASESKEVQ
jgi:hypothetical protein